MAALLPAGSRSGLPPPNAQQPECHDRRGETARSTQACSRDARLVQRRRGPTGAGGHHGRRAGTGLRYARCGQPAMRCAVSKGSAMSRIRRIMLASDFSTASRPALRNALELARSTRARLRLVHALGRMVAPMMGEGVNVSPATWNQIEAGARKAAQKQLDRLLQTARKSGVRATGLFVEGSPAADRIVRAARARRVDLLVLGTNGRTGLSRLVLGSVAARVIATASCPVLTVRARR